MRLIFSYIIVFSCLSTFGQYPKFEIGGLSRALADNSFLDKKDTVNTDATQDFNLVFDLAINGELNKFINFYSELRLGNSLEVFDTSSSYINLRRILIYGKLSEKISFEIGDIDLKMTPFTLWNYQEEGIVNENRLSSSFREIQQYENFNNGNFWRRQGLVISGYNTIFKNDTISYKTFGTREIASNEISTPDVFLYGSEIKYQSNIFALGFNHIDLFSNYKGINYDTNLNNHVFSANINFNYNKINIESEFGFSSLTNTLNNFDGKWINGEFINIGFDIEISKNLSFSTYFRSVSEDFSSPGSQSKRINYSRSPNNFPQINNNSSNRDIFFSDIIYDINFIRSNSFYNRIIDYKLDDFNPIFGVIQPYGLATPNRRGISSKFTISDSSKIILLSSEISFLNDLVGEGISSKRNYSEYSLSLDFHLNRLLNFDKKILFKGGFSNSTSKREHPEILNVQNIDLSCRVADLGLEFQIINNLSILASHKRLKSKGLDYLPIRNEDFSIESFNAFNCDLVHEINSFGIAFDFSKKSSVLLNYQILNFKDNLLASEYVVNQFFVLVQIKF